MKKLYYGKKTQSVKYKYLKVRIIKRDILARVNVAIKIYMTTALLSHFAFNFKELNNLYKIRFEKSSYNMFNHRK